MINNKLENIKLVIRKTNKHNDKYTIEELPFFTSNILIIPKMIEVKNIIYFISNKIIIVLILLFFLYIIYKYINILKEKLKY